MQVLVLVAQVHQWLTVAAALCAVGVLVLAPAARFLTQPGGGSLSAVSVAIDWLVVAVPLLAALAAVLGIVLFAGTGGPREGLHAVYAVAAVVGLPLARIMGAGPPDDPEAVAEDTSSEPDELTTRMAIWLAAGAIVTLGTLLRLAGTG